jgi:hypothetical protein
MEESPVKPKAEQAGSDISVEDNGQKPEKGKNAKPVEPPKDYVHVRARRGQATDSHSLAERVHFCSFLPFAAFRLVEIPSPGVEPSCFIDRLEEKGSARG